MDPKTLLKNQDLPAIMSSSSPFEELPPEIVSNVWDFLGTGRYRLVAAINKRSRASYTHFLEKKSCSSAGATRSKYQRRKRKTCNFKTVDFMDSMDSLKWTNLSCAFESLSCAKLYMDDQKGHKRSTERRKKLIPDPKFGELVGYTSLTKGTDANLMFDIFHVAAYQGKLDILQFAFPYVQPYTSHYACSCCAKGGHLEALQWLYKMGITCNKWTFASAAGHGSQRVLDWLLSIDCPYDKTACHEAAKNGQIGILKWLREIGCSIDKDTCGAAASKGQIEVLQWLDANGLRFDHDECNCAAENGYLETLQWLTSKGCPVHDVTCQIAVWNDHLPVVQWLHEYAGPFDEDICDFAPVKGDRKVLRWLVDQGYDFDWSAAFYAVDLGYRTVWDWYTSLEEEEHSDDDST